LVNLDNEVKSFRSEHFFKIKEVKPLNPDSADNSPILEQPEKSKEVKEVKLDNGVKSFRFLQSHKYRLVKEVNPANGRRSLRARFAKPDLNLKKLFRLLRDWFLNFKFVSSVKEFRLSIERSPISKWVKDVKTDNGPKSFRYSQPRKYKALKHVLSGRVDQSGSRQRALNSKEVLASNSERGGEPPILSRSRKPNEFAKGNLNRISFPAPPQNLASISFARKTRERLRNLKSSNSIYIFLLGLLGLLGLRQSTRLEKINDKTDNFQYLESSDNYFFFNNLCK
jgi:hypothetical protein